MITKKNTDPHPMKKKISPSSLDKIMTSPKTPFLLFLFFLLGCFVYGIQARKNQLNYWQKNKQAFYANGQPLMTTLDAPFFINLAKVYRADNEEKKRSYPEHSIEQKFLMLDQYKKNLDNPTQKKIDEALARGEIKNPSDFKKHHEKIIHQIKADINKTLATEKIKPKEFPPLSLMIAKISPWFNNQDYLTGTYLVIFLASLFMIPLGLYFWFLGVPLAGILGALIGNFSIMYYIRSSIGRIDTDILNLFFPFLISLFILLIGKAQKLHHRIVFAILAALSMNLFMWWYPRPPFILAFFLTLIAYLLALKSTRKWQVLVPTILAFYLIASPQISFKGAVSDFFKRSVIQSSEAIETPKISNLAKPVVFPNAIKTISEAQTSFSIKDALAYTISSQFLAYIGLLSFLAMLALYWQQMIPLTPIIFLGFLSFKGSNRMIMFLAPFVGVGLGYLLTLILRQIRQYTRLNIEDKITDSKLEAKKNVSWSAITLSCSLVFFFFIKGYTYKEFIPKPSINPHIMRSFKEIKKIVPENSALLTWWDFGYVLTEQTNLFVFHDGGSQFSPKTHFIASSFVSPDQNYLFKTTKFLSTQGNSGINYHRISKDRLLKAMDSSPYNTFNPIYLLFTYDMVSKYGAFSSLGNWDIGTGTQKKAQGYRRLNCNRMQGKTLFCGQYVINLEKGLINNRIPIKRQVQVLLGKVIMEKNYPHPSNLTFQVLMDSRKRSYEFHLIDEPVYQSNFNQMYILGRYNKDLFEETYNLFPLTRLFKFKFKQDSNYASIYKPSALN